MRALALALCVACIPVAAETPSAEAGDTVTFTRAQITQMEQEVNAILRQREAAAYEAGKADVRQRCASLI